MPRSSDAALRVDAETPPPYRYSESRLSAAWYDLRGFLAARRRLLAEPRLALEGERALGFSARGFAHFLWIVMPFGVLAALASVNGFLLEQPNQVFDLSADAAAELRQRIAPDEALYREAGCLPGEAIPMSPEEREALSAARKRMVGLHIMPFISLDSAQIDAEERRASIAAIEAGLREVSEGQTAAVRLRLAESLENRLRGTENRLRFMRRMVETGAANLLGMVFTGLLLPLTAMAFAWWARRLKPPGERVDQARPVMLYLLNARLTPWMFVLVGLLVVTQIGISWQLAQVTYWAQWATFAMTLALAVVYFRCGSLIAPVLYDAPDARVARRLSWRMLWVFLLLQLIAMLWAGLLSAGMALYFHITA
ncbi:hypothetical protein [Pseudomarimonas salicorniae]|uniref:DUF3667 domain-containing protein n=1 Tax=Pseudomarimonas salicorniae TaxID=2933270 RepID=A0ABT0GG22_9GAMM|nr:hypothetical protein [Lysobacter sp. CAU 1642]MCK7593481.1 hypothetical protein [Lysobacter sp. CAU 1642]